MTHTDKSTVLALAIVDIISLQKADLQLDNVYYGDQNNMTGARNVVVTCGTKRRDLAGVSGPGGRGMNNMEIIITIYNSKYGSEENQRLVVDQLAESVEEILHSDTTIGGTIIHGYVTDWIPGVAFKEANSQYRAVQLIFLGRTKTNITL